FSVNIGSDFGVPPDGTYAFGVGADNGLSTGNWALLYVGMTAPPPGYAVTFSESGLPPGDSWSVTLNGQTQSSSSSTITFTEPNGTYSYFIGKVGGYYAEPSSGSVVVNGKPSGVYVSFSTVKYPITFSESGLPPGTSWSVTLNGQTRSSTSSQIVFEEVPGTYSYSVGQLTGYFIS
ncbi:MAG: DUF7619 domain-containing protein, partial [Thermoprotei archaeon]